MTARAGHGLNNRATTASQSGDHGFKIVIPGLVPGTKVSNSAAIGPRNKSGDDVIVRG